MKRKGKDINRNLSLPDVTTIDNVKQFPRYCSILERQNGEGVGIEEIDTLQMEIETLLVNALQRARSFQVELMVLENKAASDLLNQIKPKPHIIQAPPVHPPPQPIPFIETPNSKRFKGSSSAQQRPSSTFTCNTDENSTIVRSDISDIFWNEIIEYRLPIVEDDIKYLNDQIELNNKIQINYNKEIQTLGKHYSIKWTEEDIGGEIKESSRLNLNDINGTFNHTDRRRKNFNNFFNEIESFQQSNNPSESSSQQYGPLTQRLISALIEQNLMTPISSLDTDDGLANNTVASKQQNSHDNVAKSNSNLFENKIRDELIEQGILDKNDLEPDIEMMIHDDQELVEDKDEIGEEIKKLQNELLLVTGKCKDSQIELLNKAKQAIVQQGLRKKIDQCDVKIQELFAKSVMLKQSKKYCPRKDKERLNELIREREAIKLQMNEILF
jgi:transcriptional adapter 3